MLVDDITLRLEAGHGGNGAVAFNKVRLMQGPTGGDGGQGGSIYFDTYGVLGKSVPQVDTKKGTKIAVSPGAAFFYTDFIKGKSSIRQILYNL